MEDRILRRTQVEEMIGLKRSQFYYLRKSGEFPAPVKLGARCFGWRLSAVQEWIASREQA